MPFQPDHTKIYRPVKKSKSKPNYGLYKKPSSWYLIYYNQAGETQFMWLNTNDEMDARRMRNKLYAAAIANGRGPKTKLQMKCEAILEDRANNYGIIYTVQLGGNRITCRTFEEAKSKQWEVARRIVKGEKV